MKDQMRNKLRDRAGFTLVELVVVIAILGILAGIGTVGYSGYIKKANEAADIQMMGQVKYVAQVGIYEEPETTGRITVDNSGAVVSSDAGYQDVIEGWLQDAFGSDWANLVKLKVSGASELVAIPVMQIDLTDEQKGLLGRYSGSNLSGNEIALANTANNLSNMLADWVTQKGTGIEALKNYFANDAAFQDFKDKYELGTDSTPNEIANAAVLYVASQANDMDAEEILGKISNGKLTEVIGTNGQLATAALLYGTMTGYANSSYASDGFKETFKTPPTGLSDVFEMLDQLTNEAGAEAYMKDTNNGAFADMDGYLAAMNLINDYAEKGAFHITMDNAFNNDSTLSLLQGILNAK